MPEPFHTLDVICPRRQRFIYVSSPVCEVDFSSSGEPSLVLNPFRRRRGPTGFIIVLANGRLRFRWDTTEGAICYSLYRREGGEYVLVAECIPCEACVPPVVGECCYECEDCPPGCYAITTITEDGETEPSAEVCIAAEDECSVTITTSSPLPAGAFNAPYAQQLDQEFGQEATEQWSLIAGALPAGLTLSLSGLISGTPIEGGNFVFTADVFAMCSETVAGENSKEFLLNIAGGPEPTCIYRFVDYDGTTPIFVAPAASPISADPEWDGVFNLLEVGAPASNYWYKGSNEVFSVPFGVGPNVAVGGKGVSYLRLRGPNPANLAIPDVYWDVFLVYENQFGPADITWVGYKVGGDTSTGVGTYVSGEVLLPLDYPPGTFSDPRVAADIELCP